MEMNKLASENVSGQSTIEFLATFTFSFLFLFFFLKVALNYSKGYVAHYATFMASRAFLVYDNHSTAEAAATTASKNVFKSFWLDKVSPDQFGTSNVDSNLKFNTFSDMGSSGALPMFKGAYFDYEEQFSVSNVLGGTDTVTLRSESFLGREPTRIGCLAQICKALETLADESACDKADIVTLSDNGC